MLNFQELNWGGRWHSDISWSDVPPVEASGGQEQYYARSSWHSEECNWECSGQSVSTPHRGIWWPRAVLCKVILTFWRMQLRMQWTVSVNPPQRHLVAKSSTMQGHIDIFIFGMQLRRKLTVRCTPQSIQILLIENWAIYVDWCFCCCCYCVIVLLQQQQNDTLTTCYCVIVLLQQQNDTWKTTRTRTKRLIYMHFLFNDK